MGLCNLLQGIHRFFRAFIPGRVLRLDTHGLRNAFIFSSLSPLDSI